MNHKQTGIATLAVTIILILIASIATLYANRQAFVFQKTSANYYANSKAFEAAEAGANEFAARVLSDLNKISTGTGTVELIQQTTASGPGACLTNFFNAYKFTAPYADTANPNQFANDRFFSKRINTLGVADALGLGYQVTARMSGLNMTITSTGCADDSTTSPSNTAPACTTAGQPRATVTVTLPLKGVFNPSKSAFSIKGYADAFGAISTLPASGQPAAACPIMSGDSFTHAGSVDATITPFASIAALTPDQYFESFFGAPKSTIKAAATAAGTAYPGGSCPIVPSPPPLTIWIDGDLNLTGACTLKANNIIVNGNINAGAHPLNATGLLYGNNFYTKAAQVIYGAVALAGNLDVAALNQPLANSSGVISNNGKQDGVMATGLGPTHAAFGTISVYYDPSKLKDPSPPGGTGSQFKAGLWHDF
ncbi:PilX N-terminal domain-containing pilus assembly protein [Deefgea salmonis]|uniref:Type 4 fimbrial biogenesis protein PilX N-terminal domain-containing protein n=1 Tax=Deefgea salmonis TaxID=2875502 RepID=A0ABS8BJN1_9NEIS|nr:PilX N-terminal domain-containing pilus assembly protein [Deefgea salmonis]MCB5195934.1 hypothetical protein [Deefgea salmonis]